MLMSKVPIYLDFNATTPIDPAVVDAMRPYLDEHFGNPSSTHAYGQVTKEAVERAREQVAHLIGAQADEIVFTSGGSESNNMAILGAARARQRSGGHIVTSAVEHPAVLAPCRALEIEGVDTTYIEVDALGRVDEGDVGAAFRDDTVLVTVMRANNEVGTLQPVGQIAEAAHARGILVHTDAAQAVGKIPVGVDDLGVDLLTIAGHKLYGPKGVGALYQRDGLELPPLIHGASHERGCRAGTENVAGVVGLGAACEIAAANLDHETSRLAALRDRLWARLSDAFPSAHRHGDVKQTLPNTLSVGFPGVTAGDVLRELGDRVAASAGAACHAEGVSVSTVLAAMGVPENLAVGTIRLSVGRMSTEAEMDEAAGILVAGLRQHAGGTR